jgi:hypothetical protein
MLATAPVASVADPTTFRSGHNFSAWIGVIPKQYSSGGMQRLGSISSRRLEERANDLSASAHSIANRVAPRFEVASDVLAMPAEDCIDFGMLFQFFECICPRRIQQPIHYLRFVDLSCN